MLGKKKSLWRHIIDSPITVVVIVAVSIPIAYAVYERYTVERDMFGRRNDAEETYQQAIERRDGLYAKVEHLSRPEGVEAELRRNYDLAEPGERVVVMYDTATSSTEDQMIPHHEKEQTESLWSRIVPW